MSIFKEIPSGLVGEFRLIITATGLSVFVGSHAEFFFEKYVKLRKVFISNLRCNINDFHFCMRQKVFCVTKLVVNQILVRGYTETFLKDTVQMRFRVP